MTAVIDGTTGITADGSLKLDSSGGGTFTITPPSSATDRTLTLPDEAGTVLTSASDITQNAGTAFFAHRSSTDGDQTISNATWTKVLVPTEDFDADSSFASSKFTAKVAGYYRVSGCFRVQDTSTGVVDRVIGAFYKNGTGNTNFGQLDFSSGNGNKFTINGTRLYYLNVDDYVELYAYAICSNAPKLHGSDTEQTYFTGELVRAGA